MCMVTFGGYAHQCRLSQCLLLAGSTGEQLPDGYVPTEIPMLFGNGGSATLLEYDETAAPVYGLLRSIGRDFKMLASPFSGQRHPFGPWCRNSV